MTDSSVVFDGGADDPAGDGFTCVVSCVSVSCVTCIFCKRVYGTSS